MRIFLFFLLGVASVFGEEAFLRVHAGRNHIDSLEVAVKTYRIHGEEPKWIQLVGVSHVGTPGYYEGLQDLLNEANVVLFEGVDGDHPAFRQATVERSPERSNLQVNLARALGLVFQLHHIDYTPEHFLNSDLTSVQLLALFEGEEMPESGPAAQAQMEQLLAGMEEATLSGQAAAAVLDFLEMRPGWSRAMRWGMVNILGSVTGNVAEYPGLPEHLRTLMTVLIENRNEKVVADIHEQLELLPEGGTIAVFYGAAHMHDFEIRLQKEWDAELTDTEWRTAFSGNLQTSGLNVLQKKLVSWFVNQQVMTLKVISTPASSPEE